LERGTFRGCQTGARKKFLLLGWDGPCSLPLSAWPRRMCCARAGLPGDRISRGRAALPPEDRAVP